MLKLPRIETVYFGGGTPGLFDAEEIGSILETIQRYLTIEADAEMTLEANPEGMASDPKDYLDVGINRLSIGVQSFQPNELKRLSRVHSQAQVYRFFEQARRAGFDNISIDLMYGIPEQTMASWQDTLRQVVTLSPEHISMYGLQLEEGTALETLVRQKRMTLPPDDSTVDFYFEGIRFLAAHGYQLYEISNLSLPGRASRHNLCYWDNQPFWGWGVSAHGYIDNVRYENPANLQTYLKAPGEWAFSHTCTPQEQLENAFIFGLRKRTGVSIAAIEATYHISFADKYEKALSHFFDADLLRLENGVLKLTPQAIPLSNEILSVFIEETS